MQGDALTIKSPGVAVDTAAELPPPPRPIDWRHTVRSLWFACVVLGSSLLGTSAAWGQQTPGFFGANRGLACNLRQPRTTVSVGAGKSDSNVAYVDLCDVTRPGYQMRALFVPGVQYVGVSSCFGNGWPLCVQPDPNKCDEPPDRGYRYPLVLPPGTPAPRIRQDPAVDGWSVCATATATSFISDPLATCPAGFEEIGRCEASAHYYEKFRKPGTSFPGETFYGFVLTHPDCEYQGAPTTNCETASFCKPCAHDVVSAIESCKMLCDRYLGQLGFDVATLSWKTSGVAHTLATEDVSVQGFCNLPVSTPSRPVTCPMTPYELCLEACGPPLIDNTGLEDAPPWVSECTTPPQYDTQNIWYFALYGRERDPNDNLDGYLRTTTVNRDKESAGTHVCQEEVNKYCNLDSVIPPGTPNITAVRTQCKVNQLPSSWPFPLPLGDFNLGDPGNGGFCDHFFRANYQCPGTCFTCGNDCSPNPNHQCQGQGGNIGTPGSMCVPATATCQ